MKFVFLLAVVALCVMYMHAPVMQAKSLHKRNAEGGAQEKASGKTHQGRPHDKKVRKNEGVEKPPGGNKEEEGELHKGDGQVRKNEGVEKRPGENEELEGELHKGGGQASGKTHQGRPHAQKVRKNEGVEKSPGENELEKGELNEGDGQNPESTERKKRSATDPMKIHPWPSTSICYKFKLNSYEQSYGDRNKDGIKLKDLMESASAEWNWKAGLNFYYDQDGSDCIEVKNGTGCWSWIGYQGEGKNEINLEWPSCFHRGVILHEMGHAIGLVHEAKRSDRLTYISVVDENVEDDALSQFTIDPDAVGIASTYEHSGEYDYCSIMHYSSTAFSTNGDATIEVTGSNDDAEDLVPCMGSQIGLSIRDGEGAADIYGTLEEDQTKVTNAGCKFSSYLLNTDETTCRCSNLFEQEEGGDCDTPITDVPDGATCGTTTLTLGSDDVQTFKTPLFDGTNDYPFNSMCTWVFTAPEDMQLCIAFPNGYKVEGPATSGNCYFDWFEIVLDPLLTLKTRRYCDSDIGWYSAFDTTFAALVFESDEAYAAKGFEGVVTAIDGGLTGTAADDACKSKIESSGSTDSETTMTDYETYIDDVGVDYLESYESWSYDFWYYDEYY